MPSTKKWIPLMVAFALCSFTAVGRGATGDEEKGEPEGGEVPFSEARIFIEFNSTGNDLGFHTFLDAEDWAAVQITNPDDRVIFRVRGGGAFGALGMTELFFEGAEPSLDDVSLDRLLAAFPEGEYEFEGITVEGDELESSWMFSHLYPDPPVILAPDEFEIVDPRNLVIEWEPVTGPDGVEILEYEIIIGALDPVMKSSLRVPPTVSSLKIPSEMLLPNARYEFEVVAVEVNRNQTLTTSFFATP